MMRVDESSPRESRLWREPASLAWLVASGIGAALAALVLAGILAGRLGLPVRGELLLAAALLGLVPRAVALTRRQWVVRWHELVAVLIGLIAVGAVGIGLAWPALLPLGLSVDAVHHSQLISWIAEHEVLPRPDGDLNGRLGEMTSYPVGMALVVIAAARMIDRPPIDVLYPVAAIVGALIAALVVLLSNSAGGAARTGSTELESHAGATAAGTAHHATLRVLALLLGPLLLLAHRTYLLEAYIDHSYYTMVLGVLLVLLAAGWLIVEPRLTWGAVAQLGLVLAALMGTYPLWMPLPAALAVAVILRQGMARRGTKHQRPRTEDDRRWTMDRGLRTEGSGQRSTFYVPRSTFYVPRSTFGGRWSAVVGRLVLAFGPALALALLDVLPRMRIGQSVLAHEGLVTLPTAERLMPILLALPCAALLVRGRRALRLLSLTALAALALLALALAARLGLAAIYHSYKVLFVLTPLSAAIAGAGALQLAAWAERRCSLQPAYDCLRAVQGRGTVLFSTFMPFAINRGPRVLVIAGIALVLACTGSFRIVPRPAIQILNRDLVAAAQWLRANKPKEAGQALVVGAPTGPLAYWVQIGLLSQRRDRAHTAVRALTDLPPSPETWLVDRRLARLAIVPQLGEALPGMTVLARFGDVAVVQRDAVLDLAALNPLTIRYRTIWEDGRLKTAIELERPVDGRLPLLQVLLHQAGDPPIPFDLPPEQDRTRPQYLGVDLLPATLGGEGYINRSAYPAFAPPALAPTGTLTLTLRLSLDGNTLDERQLATFVRSSAGAVTDLALSSGELIYLQRGTQPARGGAEQAGADFGGALRLVGRRVSGRANAGKPLDVDLNWQADRPLARSLFPEVLLLDARGQPVASSLAAPQEGFYPTWRWRAGERVDERRSIVLPPDLRSGDYRLAVRVWDLAGRRVLSVSGGARADGLVELGTISVE